MNGNCAVAWKENASNVAERKRGQSASHAFSSAATEHVTMLHSLTCLTSAYQFRTGCC